LGLQVVVIVGEDGFGAVGVADTLDNTRHPCPGSTEVPETGDDRDDLVGEPIRPSHSYPREDCPMHDVDRPGEDSSTALERDVFPVVVAGAADAEDVGGAKMRWLAAVSLNPWESP
jgi:hypothetical protein